MLPWDDARVWSAMKPTMPWGQIPCLTYKVMTIKQNSRGTNFSVKGREDLSVHGHLPLFGAGGGDSREKQPGGRHGGRDRGRHPGRCRGQREMTVFF